MKDINYNLSSRHKGKIGELEVIKRLCSMGIPVYTPIVDDGIDIVANINGEYISIQVKSTVSKKSKDVIKFELTSNTYDSESGNKYKVKHGVYDPNKVNYFALYDIESQDLFLIKNTGKKGISLRTRAPKNNQKRKVNYKSNYDFDTVINYLINGIDNYNIVSI